MHTVIRRRFVVAGQVQGVGFRPFVYRQAQALGLTGLVRNSPEGVLIEIQGPPAAVDRFAAALADDAPPLARVVSLVAGDIPAAPGESAFRIGQSAPGQGHNVFISPDTATCADCLADMADPKNRRHGYPFTNCTNCGPRYTITHSIPYDRAGTSMACFPLCPDCAAEYQNPLDRRFHAQPNACPVCGPRPWLTDRAGATLARGPEALAGLAAALAGGAIAAVKGLGGFHLACDATDDQAVGELRRRKNRPSKPLAVMVADLDAAARLAEIGQAEAELLSGAVRPIVLCRARDGASSKTGPEAGPAADPEAGPALSSLIGPDTREIGLMLPYTPLHHVLFKELAARLGPSRLPALVMTSGNASSEPIALGNREALARLADIADVFLFHDRDILVRTDDSVLRVLPGSGDVPAGPQFLRRARGYVPSPIGLGRSGPPVVGLGPEQKATICLTKRDQAFMSQHLGDLENLETYGFYREVLAHLAGILKVEPVLGVRDLHPDYLSTRFALDEAPWPSLPLQHHFAHIHAVLAESGRHEPAVGLALDGTGLGPDGTLWGGEGLFVDPRRPIHRRLGHFSRFCLPGGTMAILEPWRVALSLLLDIGERDPAGLPDPLSGAWPFLAGRPKEAALVATMRQKGLNCPETSSCGRLFDAVAALLGLCQRIDYEGQAAIRLEQVQDMAERGAYDAPLLGAPDDLLILDATTLFSHVAADVWRGAPAAIVSRRFHLGLIRGLTEMARRMADLAGAKRVALSGGVMQNRTLALELPRAIEAAGLIPLTHRLVPPNDACISLGQAAYGQIVARGA